MVAITGLGVVVIAFASAGEDPPKEDVLKRGAELFAREWLPGDGRGSGGDGLGPVYNETSCVACHHQGGPGGAGPTSTNVEILSARSFGADAGDLRRTFTLAFGHRRASSCTAMELILNTRGNGSVCW